MTVGDISWNIIWAHDLKLMADWYEHVLGLKIRHRQETVVSFDTGHTVLNLMGNHANGPDSNPESIGWKRNQMVFVFKVDDMDELIAALAAKGAEPAHVAPVVIDGQSEPKWRVAQYLDPEGNMIEFCDEPVRWSPFLND